jgi:integrase
MSTRLTWEQIQQARALGRLTYIWERGLGARIAKDGKITWVLQRWEGGRTGKAKRIVLGHYSDHDSNSMTLEKARQVAATQHQLSTSLGGVVKTYFTSRRKPGRFWKELEARWESEVIPLLGGGGRVPSSITKQEIRTIIVQKAKKHPTAALTMFQSLGPFFKWLVENDYIQNNPMDSLSPPKAPEARDRVLAHDEIKLVWAGATDLGYPWKHFYHLLLVLGQRRNEVAGMQWLETRGGVWYIPKERTKNAKSHLVPLSKQAQAILDRLTPTPLSPFVFTTNNKTPISGFSKAKAQLDKSVTIAPWRIHDLRRTVATEMQRIGVPIHVIDKVLNHSENSLREVYQRYQYLPEKTEALEKWGQELQNILGTLWEYV